METIYSKNSVLNYSESLNKYTLCILDRMDYVDKDEGMLKILNELIVNSCCTSKLDIILSSEGGSVYLATTFFNILKKYDVNVEVITMCCSSAAAFISIAKDKTTMHEGTYILLHQGKRYPSKISHQDFKLSVDEWVIDNEILFLNYFRPFLTEDELLKFDSGLDVVIYADDAFTRGIIGNYVDKKGVKKTLAQILRMDTGPDGSLVRKG